MPSYSFGEFQLDPDAFELRRGSDPVEIGPKPLDLLTYLVLNRTRTVGRAELLDRVWNASAMSTSTVPTCIASIRKALGDRADAPRYLRTDRGRGYRFIAEVTTSEHTADDVPEEIPSSPFVGRQLELDALTNGLEDALRGTSRLFLLTGEPGIGKTRTVHEFLKRASPRPVVSVLARCQEAGAAPPFWPWIHVLRDLYAHADQAIFSKLDETATKIIRAIPELKQHLPNSIPLPSLDSPKERFRLFDAVTSFIQQVAQRGPLILAFDDIHRADLTSLQLLRFVVAESGNSGLLLVATYRSLDFEDDEDIRDQLSQLAGEPWVRHLPLPPLTFDEVSRYVQSILNRQLPDVRLRSSLFEKSGGNPLFLGQLLALIEAVDPSESRHHGISLPRATHEVTRRHLAGLPAESNQTLRMAAVIGREFDTQLLASAMQQPLERILAWLEPARKKQLVVHSLDRPGGLRFSHTLIRDFLYDTFELNDRVAFHKQVAKSLETTHSSDLGPHTAELAHHYSHAGDSASLGKAADYASLAADWSAVRLAHEDAARHLRLALRALQASGLSDPRRRCTLLVRLGEATIRSGDREQGTAYLREGFSLADALDCPDLQARAALALAPGFFATDVGIVDPLLIRMLERALTTLGQSNNRLRAQLAARLSIALVYEGADERREALSSEALALSRDLHDPETLAYALSARHGVLWDANRAAEREQVIRDLGRAARSIENPEFALIHRLFRLTYSLEQGDIGAVDREIGVFSRTAKELALPHFLWQASLLRAMRLLMIGRFEESEPLAREFLAMGQRAQADNAIQSYGVQLVLRLWEKDRLGECLTFVEDLCHQYPAVPGWSAALAFIYSEIDRDQAAREALRRLGHLGFGSLPRNETSQITLALLSQTAANLRCTDVAQELYRLLLPSQEHHCVVAFGVAYWGTYARVLGMLAALLERWQDSESHFERALIQDQRIGAIPWVAHDHYHYARMLIARKHRGDAKSAQRHLESALSISRRLGMNALQHRIASFVQA